VDDTGYTKTFCLQNVKVGESFADFVVGGSMLMMGIIEEHYKNLTLPVVLHGCETWLLTVREEHRLMVSESTVLRKIFGLKRSEVDCVRKVMAHSQKQEFVFRRNRRVYLNRQGHQFSRLLAAEVCASEVVMLDTRCS
jgi:hypothetical protein